MYLISIYFDEETNKRIKSYICQVAKSSGNSYMLDGQVPPHITISAFEAANEKEILNILEKTVSSVEPGILQWVSVGQFFPYVLFLSPVLNEYLHNLCIDVYNAVKTVDNIRISRFYRPFQWMPHTTIGKKMSQEEMQAGFAVMQKNFSMFSGQVVRIGLAKTNPYQDIADWVL